MDDHLDLEDREVVPQFGRWFSAAEYEELTKAAMKQVGLGKQAAFTVPYVGFWSSEEERTTLLGAAPLPFRILYRLTRKRHFALDRGGARRRRDRRREGALTSTTWRLRQTTNVTVTGPTPRCCACSVWAVPSSPSARQQEHRHVERRGQVAAGSR